MMIEKKTQLYNLEFRFADGALTSAYASYRYNILEDGVVVADAGSFATAITDVPDDDKPTIVAVLGDVMVAALAAKEAAEAQVKEAGAAVAAKDDTIEALTAEAEAKDANIQSLLARVAELEAAAAPVVDPA